MFAGLTLAGVLLLLRRYKAGHSLHLWTSCGLIGMGVLDGFHAASVPGNTFVWFRGTATLMGGIGFSLVRLPERVGHWRLTKYLPLVFFVIAMLIGIVSAGWPQTLPAMLKDQKFTATPRLLNTLGASDFLWEAPGFIIATKNRQGSKMSCLRRSRCCLEWRGFSFGYHNSWKWTGGGGIFYDWGRTDWSLGKYS
jgi:hypothetical protein